MISAKPYFSNRVHKAKIGPVHPVQPGPNHILPHSPKRHFTAALASSEVFKTLRIAFAHEYQLLYESSSGTRVPGIRAVIGYIERLKLIVLVKLGLLNNTLRNKHKILVSDTAYFPNSITTIICRLCANSNRCAREWEGL